MFLWLLKQVGLLFAILFFMNFFNPPKLGSTVAPLKGLKFIKGEACDVPNTKEGKVTVLELWATWCPPCVKSIPHLTEIAHKFGSDVTFVGVTQESDEAKVRAFVENMGAQMDYTVAIDLLGDSRMVAKDSGGMGIPHAIVINGKGVMVWAGHPMSGDFENAIREA
ncbi:thioredoxin-like protein [Rhizoclosmatium globosum]|uniref:Thioredoxin-like protein n=1 Tax=Rhizoclosmatium globosum TaxID=329046 RepID=A0A1Y2BV12_9FUNG|nr:thioredoxin-like protein [Rhizoclosmatium globosum]|eukprot:ORY38514.1 thioredoxin-like protein [Rhizoclosmatium globosum]